MPDSTEVALGTDPFNPDSDADTYSDSIEVAYGSNPKDGASTPDQSTPLPLVNLDATTLPVGSLPVWTNMNALGWRFVASTNAPSVQMVDGTKGVVFDGTDYYTGPNIPTYLGGNSARTMEAWVWNPQPLAENFVISWGHRGGNPDGSNNALSYGTDPAYGAIQFWGAYDSPWGTNTTQINENVRGGQWSFIAATYDPATSNKVVYLNGQPVLSAATPGPLATWVDDPTDKLNQQTPPVGRTTPIRIAAENGSSLAPAGDNASGAFSTLTMAKIRAYNVALSAQQIADQYNAEKAQFPGALEIKNVRVNTANGIIVFDWTPIAGKTYAVDGNSDLSDTNGWSSVATGLTSGSYTNNNTTDGQEFFRLRQEN